MHSGTNVPNEIARQIHFSHVAMVLCGCPGNGAQPRNTCHLPAHPGKAGTEVWTWLLPLCQTWPSPCYAVLDVVEKTLGHEWVLVQVDQVGRLAKTNK